MSSVVTMTSCFLAYIDRLKPVLYNMFKHTRKERDTMPKPSTVRQTAYDSKHCRFYGLKLNLETDSDIIGKLASVDNMQGYIKQLIRDDIRAETEHSKHQEK